MPTLAITTKPGKKYRSLRRPRTYEALRKQGYSKQSAARISNAQAHKAFTLAQLESFVSSPHYDPATAGAIAQGIPLLPSLKGEQIAPGITRIHGNLCNVHGKYGPCDKALSGKKPKGGARKPAKARQTPAQRAQARTAQREQNSADVAKRMADNDTGLAPAGAAALTAFAKGQQPDPRIGDGLASMGLAERAADGSYRMTPTGRAVAGAMAAGDYQRAVDGISRATDAHAARQGRQAEHAKRQQDAAGKRASTTMGRELAKREREDARAKREAERAAKKPAKASAGGSKKPAAPATEKPLKVRPTKRVARSSAPSVGGAAGAAANKKPIAAPKPEKAPAKQIAPALQIAAQSLSDGAELSDADALALVRNGLAKPNKDGTLVLTAAGMRATTKAETYGGTKRSNLEDSVFAGPDRSFPVKTAQDVRDAVRSLGRTKHDKAAVKRGIIRRARAIGAVDALPDDWKTTKEPSFRVFKDASGRYRWVAQSSTAFEDRDREIVSTKALEDDCAFADTHGAYGPLRWWHTPGLDLGDCDFNAMHGRVLIESGTFRSPLIAQKVAAAAAQLEISLGFLHLPTEPDAAGVFHHIRRFERSLVPRGKASNRFTAFTVKEIPMETVKREALKVLGFSDADIDGFEANGTATEKAADAEQIAYKSDDVTDAPDLVINGVTYKAFGAPKVDDATTTTTTDDVVEEDAMEPMDEEPVDDSALTLSSGDLAAIGEAIAGALQGSVAQIMGALDLEKKVAGHVQGLMAPFQATKDATDAEKAAQIAALKAQQESFKAQQESLQLKLDELLGLQPEVAPRASSSPASALNPFNPADVELLQAAKEQGAPAQYTNGFEDLKLKLFGP